MYQIIFNFKWVLKRREGYQLILIINQIQRRKKWKKEKNIEKFFKKNLLKG